MIYAVAVRLTTRSIFVLIAIGTYKEHQQKDTIMDATHYIKEATALLGLFLTIYMWSLLALALQG